MPLQARAARSTASATASPPRRLRAKSTIAVPRQPLLRTTNKKENCIPFLTHQSFDQSTMARPLARVCVSVLVCAALVRPSTSLDRPLFVPSARVPGLEGSAPRPQPPAARVAAKLQGRSGRVRMSLGAGDTRRPDVGGRGSAEELNLLRCALDRMELRGVRCQQLAVHEQAQLHRYARAVARNAADAAYLTTANAAWAVAGRWRLVLAPQEWSWLLGFSPGADVLVSVFLWVGVLTRARNRAHAHACAYPYAAAYAAVCACLCACACAL